MGNWLILRLYLLDDRYHGEGDWPPAPARLFQALVAGNAIGARLPEECVAALRWLESDLDPPLIRAQRVRLGRAYKTYVPNNDLDAVGGDPSRIDKIRVAKHIQPRHLDARQPLIYGWRFHGEESALAQARMVIAMAENLYQLGRGVDMAFAQAELLGDAEGAEVLANARGELFRPGVGETGIAMPCPDVGSLDSLQLRFAAQRRRFTAVKDGRKTALHFTNPPKASFQQVSYNAGFAWRLYELRADVANLPFRPWPQVRVAELVTRLHDRAAARLATALPEQADIVTRLIIGRDASASDKARRVRIIPIPSIGHEHTSRAVRRLMIRVPPDCPLPFGDIDWAFSGLDIEDSDGRHARLIKADDLRMLHHYGIETGEGQKVWQTMTPVALPLAAARRRIDPKHRAAEAKGGEERAEEEARATAAVLAALRHADAACRVESIRVQREPFSRNGVRAEAFADGTRFTKERLWHVELRLRNPKEGPLLLGDGRYLGLGLMAPKPERASGVLAFRILDAPPAGTNPEQLARDLRRAVMARVQQQLGPRRSLPALVTGHTSKGAPLRDGHHRHLAFVADLPRSRLLVIAPHQLSHKALFGGERDGLKLVEAALTDFDRLAAGRAGMLHLEPATPNLAEDALCAESHVWQSVTHYRPTRHAKGAVTEALVADVRTEVVRLGLPRPEVEILRVHQGLKGGISASLRLRFPASVRGPLILGRTRHLGGGVFAGEASASSDEQSTG